MNMIMPIQQIQSASNMAHSSMIIGQGRAGALLKQDNEIEQLYPSISYL
jgi:hypothetical protein